jgi:DHA1 family inner membrane transport protein
VLPQVAEGLDVSIPTAGYLVSGYALGIALGGPLLTIATARLPRKTLLIGLAVAFTAGQLACALAPGFAEMLLIRIAVAIAHGAYFGVAMVVAVGLVKEERRGMAVALILAGLTVSNIVGVPAGTAIGNFFGWRATFWAMFALGLLATAAMIALLPRANGRSARPAGFLREVQVLGRQQVWTSLILMLMLMIGQFVPFTYIAPMLREVTGIEADMIPWVLLLNGVGATAGVFIGGRLAGWKLMPSLIAMFALQGVVLAAMYLVSPYPLPMVAVITLWGGINFAIGTPIQTRILGWTADAPNLASSLIPAGFNIGIALAASIGSMLLASGMSYRSLPLLGVLAMTVATAVAFASYTSERRSGARPPLTAPAA